MLGLIFLHFFCEIFFTFLFVLFSFFVCLLAYVDIFLWIAFSKIKQFWGQQKLCESYWLNHKLPSWAAVTGRGFGEEAVGMQTSADVWFPAVFSLVFLFVLFLSFTHVSCSKFISLCLPPTNLILIVHSHPSVCCTCIVFRAFIMLLLECYTEWIGEFYYCICFSFF